MKAQRHFARSACLAALLLGLGSPVALRAQEAVRLHESFAPAAQYHVSTRTDLSGSLQLSPEKGQTAAKPLPVVGTSAIEYDERLLSLSPAGDVDKTVRIYRRIDFQRRVGTEAQQATIRPGVRRLVLLRRGHVGVPFSPDGPLTWGEIDEVRTDVFTPALAGMLPPGSVRPGDSWTAADSAVQELTDLEKIDEGKVQCRLEEITTLEKRRHARVGFAGTVRGVNEDGPNRQQIEGYFFFDLESNHLGYLSLRGVESLLSKDGKELGRIEGQFVLTRQARQHASDLNDEALRGVVLEPNDDNTLLLYDNAALGVRLLHPRRWRIVSVHGRQIAMDESEGSGLLLTLEDTPRLPSGAQFQAESIAYLKQQKGTVREADSLRRVQGPPQELEHFALDVELAGKHALMDYHVVRQPAGGALLAARLLPTDLSKRQKEVDAIARSVVVSKPVPPAARR